jgi:hypothetical protein
MLEAELADLRREAIAHIGRDYPVQLIVNDERAESRFWGHPIIGVLVRLVGLVPHMLWMVIIGFLGLLWLVLIGWIPILLTRRVPSFQAEIFEELVHRGSRMGAYLLLLPGYPRFGVGQPGPVDVRFDIEGLTIDRRWGIPVIGLAARLIALIPHYIVLFALGLFTAIIWLFVWIPIFINARIPTLAARIFGSYLRYSARVASYAFLLPVPYPPFTLK